MNQNNLAEQIFEILRTRGPQCQSQLSAGLLIGTREIQETLKKLKALGLAEPLDEGSRGDQTEAPWGLAIPHVLGVHRNP